MKKLKKKYQCTASLDEITFESCSDLAIMVESKTAVKNGALYLSKKNAIDLANSILEF